MEISRRDFFTTGTTFLGAGCLALALRSSSAFGQIFKEKETETEWEAVEARHYNKLQNLKVECQLCPRKCKVADRERGACGVRENRGGTYYTLVYSRVCSKNVDPIEKKPLFHFLPGSPAYSIATPGCNFECRFCQNWEIAQFRPEQVQSVLMTPQRVVSGAKVSDCTIIAYTYSEPVIFYEYMFDCAKAGNKDGMHSVMISNGYIEEKPLRELCQVLSAVKIDLKAFTEKFYKDICSGELKPVLRTLEILKENGIWFEIVVLIIPTLNDSPDEISRMSDFIVTKLGPDVPVHFTRFHPTYKIKNLPPTPVETLEKARTIAMGKGMHYPYVGNVWGHPAESTYCPGCKKPVIRRIGFQILENRISNGKCQGCGTKIAGVWSQNDLRKVS
jgi:pyruvate formate lyase activating enzyme